MSEKETTLTDKINEYALGCDRVVITTICVHQEYSAASILSVVNGMLIIEPQKACPMILARIKNGYPVNARFMRDGSVMVASVSQVAGTLIVTPHTLDGLDIYRTPEVVERFKQDDGRIKS